MGEYTRITTHLTRLTALRNANADILAVALTQARPDLLRVALQVYCSMAIGSGPQDF